MEFFNGRNSMSPLLLLLILFTLLGNILSKHHIRHHRDRFKRQQGAHLYLPGTFVTSEGEGPDSGPWSGWSEPSPCSRTCGGGVSTQQRQCHYGYECQGPSRKHFSCNTQDCPDLSDFRSQQCSEYDRIPFEGVYYQWIPYTKAPNPCELNCMPRGERFYYRHKTYVVDGTRCNDENLNVCVEGVCQPVGCDMMLGSNTVEDPCRQCGGDGSMCNTVSDVLNMQDLQVGYNDILLIPGGATNIRVKESGPSNNYLAVRNTSGYYYLNGNWRIDFPRTLDFAGCRFHYDRSPRGFSAPDSITCLGPTYEPLFIVLLYQDVNVGVEYTYSVPIGILPGDGTETYAWTFDAFSPCSATCGGGVQYRNVSCAGRRTLELADRSLCDVNNEPPTAQRCNDQPCDPRWAVKQWGRCSSNCGNNGVQLRQVYCEQIIANGIASIVDDQYCINVQKPISEQPCNQGLICSEWHIGPWKPCDHLCGDGFQSRKVTCFKKTNGRIEVLDDSYCEQKPETQQMCNLRPCDGVDWVTSEWTGCENNCGLANETRRAICSSTKGEIFADDLCADLPVPVLVRQCKSTDNACNFQWYSSQWSECSAKCGSGVQTRKVFCGNPIANGIKIVDDNKCKPEKKEESIIPCTADKKQCKGEWFTGPWSQCSKECGTGEQMRKVICLRDNETVSANECDPETIAFASGECNTQTCPSEVTTVSESPEERGITAVSAEISGSTPAEGPEEGSDEDYKYVEEYDETCDDGEWVDEDEAVTSQSPPPTDDSMSVLNDEPMFGDDPEAGLGNELDVGSGSGQLGTDSILSTTIEGSGDYSTDLSSDNTMEMSEITTVNSASKSAISTPEEEFIFNPESKFGAAIPTTKSSVTTTSSLDLSTDISQETSESTDGSSTTDANASDVTEASDITDSSTDSTDVSSETDASAVTDSSADTDASDITDASEVTDSSDVTDASAGTDASDVTDASAVTDASSETDASGATDASSETDASDVTDASAVTDASSETDASGATDATSETQASDVTDASSETDATDVTVASADTDASDATDLTSATDGASDGVTTDSSGATDASTSSDEGLSGSTEESASESTDITTDVTGLSDVSDMSTISTDEVTDLTDSSESTIEGSSQVTGLSSESSSEISTIDSSEESSASGGSSELTTEESSSVSSDISSTIESSDETSDSSFGSSTESSSDGITELSSEVSSEISVSTEESETEESGLSSESTSPGSSESTIESSTEISSSEESSSQLTSESSSELTSESSTEFSSDLSSSTSDFTESSDLSSVSEISGSTDESSSEYDIWASTTEYYSSSEFSTWDLSTITDLFMPKKLRKCRRRVKKTCKDSKFGCCIDKITPAQGPFNKGCPTTTTCNDTRFGCCEDNVSVAKGKNFEGCPTSQCKESLFGCCPDNKTEAEGIDNEGCPEPPPKCQKSKFGCCEDNDTEAKGPNLEGCSEESTSEATSEATSESSSEGTSEATSEETTGSDLDTATDISTTEGMRNCDNSPFGCCPDGENSPTGEDFEGCPNILKDNCNESYFKCCPDRVTSAKGPNYKGCKMPCEENQYGCCTDGVTPAHGSNREGCCLDTQFGCCPDNIRPAQGPSLEGCGCEYSPYRCCPDNVTAALGHRNEGCGCQYSQNGCCPDDITEAQGPQYQGCPCETFQFGCCADGVTPAKGAFRQDCECKNTEFGCCSDEKTAAKGPNNTGCTCETTKYGCCLDGVYEAKGDNFEGCEETPLNLQSSCSLPKERGSCRNYTVKWFFDLDYGGCSRFWYGGCDGNNNRFKSQDDCNAVCVEPSGRDRCALPKVTGACEGYYPKWYYDTERQACSQFVYSGCLGNNNKFETSEECTQLCGTVSGAETCDQPKEEGPCRGNFVRWYFDKTSGRCSQFVYGGCKGNNNNFATESACRQQCTEPGRQRDYCSLLKAEGNCTGRDPRWYYNPSETRCMPFYYSGCNGNDNNFVSQQACEADCPKMIVKDTCHLPSETGECGNYVFRWYYDSSERRCQQFYYGGCGGNGNNFDSEEACEQRCINVVPVTTAPPLPPPTQPTPLIPVGRPTPSTTFTTDQCYLDSDTGPCRTYEARWYYDRLDGSCKQFMYGGCPGNGNNFKTVEECHDSCAAIQDLCSLPLTVGPCNGEFEQWYFNKATGSCETFKYGGCLGNDNRFEDQISCERRCRQRQPEVTTIAIPPRVTAPQPPPVDPSVCYTPVDAGNCNESIASYYYDSNAQRCSAFIYTGCNGNANRYNSEEQCERQCGKFRGQDVCNIQRDPGLCNGYIRKYYYDAVAGRCGQFAYTGCQGNGNRFSSQEECEYVCVTHEEKRPPVTNETASVICRLPVDVGPCEGGNHKHYYFDDSRGECAAFIYSGCGGNFNNFKTFQACIDLCKEFLVKTEPPIIEPIDPSKGEHPCQKYLDDCAVMRCEYGVEAYVDEESLCTKCRCEDPCRQLTCDEKSKCAVDINRNRTTYDDPTYVAVCRLVNKEGDCPYIGGSENRCDRECENDADCSMVLKCCSTGCGTSCVLPDIPVPQQLTSSLLPAFTPTPVEIGHFPPRVDENVFKPEVTAGEGGLATLTCAVQGNPTPTITWKRGHLFIDGTQPRYRLLLDGALQIITLHKTDSGIYLCAADNGLGPPIERSINLEVINSEPHSTSIVGDDENSQVVVALGAPTSLHCYAIGYPFPAVTWWKDDSMIPLRTSQFEVRKDYSLLIHSVQLSNLGVYTCQAYNGIGKAASWSVTVQALGPFESTKPEDQAYMKYIVNPPSRFTTIAPRNPLYPVNPNQINSEPPIIPTRQPPIDPNAVYPNVSAEGHRVYQVPVKVNITQTQNRFSSGSDISIGCDVEGYPLPLVQWLKDQRPLVPSSAIQISESHRLYISNAQVGDSGEYRCEAANDYSRSASTINVVVESVFIHPNCTDNQFFANCQLIVRAQYCVHKYYARFCCKSCTEAGQLPSLGPHLELEDDNQNELSNNLLRRK